MFCGPGGLALGAIQARISDPDYRIVHEWANDYDLDTCNTYRRNICLDDRESVVHGDVREMDIDSLGEIDAFAFGFPCNICFTKKLKDSVIGRTVTVTVDRPLGSYHPEHKDMYYPINYGYVEGVLAPDGEEQDAYILGVDEAIEKFTGKIIAVVHRNDDVEEKWIVAPEGMTFSKEEICEQIHFQEQYFDCEIIM